jgi:sucrose-6-phosphate hydrolase SacC (GH32 family)
MVKNLHCRNFYTACRIIHNTYLTIVCKFAATKSKTNTAMNYKTILTATIAAATMLPMAAQKNSDGISVEHLGVSNTIVRVDGNSHYLLMPVQESNDDARIDVVVDGKTERTIYVRLAKTKVDYQVPFDLTPYAGHKLLLNVVTEQSRSNVRDASNDACWKSFTLSDSFDTENREKYRPAYHHTPLYGWMNDPNGMVYKDGIWHLYYQANPYGSKWQNMTWGHSTSTDLINWDHHANAIEPDGLGTIFSGSSVVDKNNTAGFGENAIVSLFTSAGVSQMQSLAHSNDNGMTFEKYAGNPIITLSSEARDPNMFWYEPTGEWILLLAHAQEREMLIFASHDLKNWELRSSFGKGLGAQEGVWECPDMFPLKVEGSNKTKWVLLCNINPGGPFGGSATQYFVGDFDGKTFTPDLDTNGNVPTKWMDYGKDHYATVSFSDAPANRRVVLGWMSNWQYAAEVPTQQFRSANTLPRDLHLFTGKDGQIYLASAPSTETSALRGELTARGGKAQLSSEARNYTLPTANDGICEIVIDLTANSGSTVTATISNSKGEKCVVTYDEKKRTLSFDRRESGLTNFSQDFPSVTVAPIRKSDNKIQLRLFLDRCSAELFYNNGEAVMTNLIFPTEPYTDLSITATGKATVNSVNVYSINPAK